MENHTYTINGNPDFILKVRDEAAKMHVHLCIDDNLRSVKVVCGHKTYKNIMCAAEQAILDYKKAEEKTDEHETLPD